MLVKMKKEKGDDEAFKQERNDDEGETEPLSRCLIFLLVNNVALIAAIFIVSSWWSSVRDMHAMGTDMIPAPNKDRSICVPSEVQGGECNKTNPEEYIAKQIRNNIRTRHMQYMAEKLNYANVVCRKKSPAVYLYLGLNKAFDNSGNLIWKPSEQKTYLQEKSVKYDSSSGSIEIQKSGTFFITSQITEKAENLVNNGTYLYVSVISSGKKEKILESVSGACNMVSASSKRTHYIGSALYLKEGDILYASHSDPSRIVDFDSFLGIRELDLISST